MKRDSAIAAAAGILGGVLLVAAWHGSVLGIILGMMFSPLPMAMTVFGLGLAYLPVAIVGGAMAVAVLTGSVALAAFYLAFDAVPIVVLARMGLAAERQRISSVPGTAQRLEGQAIAIPVVALTMMAAAIMGVGLASYSAGSGGLEASLAARLTQMADESGMLRELPEAARKSMLEAVARVLPGAAAWNWSVRALASAVIGQALLTREGLARWPTPAYRTIAVPGWYVGVFWVAVVAAWLTPGDAGFIIANGAMVLCLPLVLQGLAVVHCAAARFGFGRLALIAFYGLSLVAAGPAIVLVVTLGVMEHFSQMRRRMDAARNGG